MGRSLKFLTESLSLSSSNGNIGAMFDLVAPLSLIDELIGLILLLLELANLPLLF